MPAPHHVPGPIPNAPSDAGPGRRAPRRGAATVTQDTVVRDCYAAMETIAAQYQIPIAVAGLGGTAPDPGRMLRDLVSVLRNHVADPEQAKRLISRVHKLRDEIVQLQPVPTEP